MNENIIYDKVEALYNNTFDFQSTERTNIHAVEHSYNYLSRVQRAMVNNHVPILIDDELSVGYNDDLDVTINVPYNLIHANDRHRYRLSEFYNTIFNIKDVIDNPDIFRYIPLVVINGFIISDYDIQTTLSEEYQLILHIDKIFIKQQHTIQVFMFENVYYKITRTTVPTFTSNDYSLVLEDINEYIPEGMDGLFFNFVSTPDSIYSTNIIECEYHKDENKIDMSLYMTDNINTFLNGSVEINITTIFIPYLHKSDTFDKTNPYLVVSNDHSMPIPKENLLIIGNDSSEAFLCIPNVISHSYPNIFKFECDDDITYQAYYYYREDSEQLRSYNNKFRFFFDYLEMKYGKQSLSMVVNNIINGTITTSSAINDYLDKILSYIEPEYEYNNKNFDELMLSEFQYKTGKLHEFIDFEPWVLKDYIIDQNKVGYRRYMYAKDIDLPSRLRLNTFQEAVRERDKITFDEPRYVFQFRNDWPTILHIRFYVDGIICTIPHSVLCEGVEYYYVPASMFNGNSVIEVERLDQYRFHQKMDFTLDSSGLQSQIINFPKYNDALPTIFDIYFTDDHDRRLTYSAFKIQPILNGVELEVDVINHRLILKNIDSLSGNIIANETEFKYHVENSTLFIDSPDWHMMGDNHTLYYDSGIDISNIVLNNAIKSPTNDTGYKDEVYIYTKDGREFKFSDAQFIVDGIGNVLHYFNSYSFLNKPIKISLNGPYYEGKTVYVNINKLSRGFNFFIQVDGPPQCLIWEPNVLNRRQKSYFRVFVNGRILEPEAYIFHYIRKGGYDKISLKKACKKGDIVSIDMNVFSYNIEYRMVEIPENYVVDVNHMLSRPLDLSVYDIYLNGRKLNETNVTFLSPSRMKISNVHSRKNLLIISKDRDSEYYGYDLEKGCETELDGMLDNVIPEDDSERLYKHIVNELNPLIDGFNDTTDDTEEDVYKDIVYNERDYNRWAFYWIDLCQIGYLNPDLVQFNRYRIRELYPYIYNEYITKCKKRPKRRIVHTSPDICYTAPVALKVGDIRNPEYLI